MDVHRLVGGVFGAFCFGLIFWHLSTPENPDHVLNLTMHPILTIGFLTSCFMRPGSAEWLQIIMLALGAIMTGSTGSFHPAACVGIIAMILVYGQGDFQTMGGWRLWVSATIQFINVAISATIYGQSLPVAIGHAVAWSVVSILAVLLFWVQHVRMATELMALNRELNKANKRLLGELDGRKN